MRERWSKILRALHLRRGLDADLSEEMRSHLAFAIEENIAQGMSPDEAQAAARRHFGNQTIIRERAHEAWQFPKFETILQDLRHGARAIRKSPGFSLAVILTLALGIGANTAIFSVVYSVLLRPLPYPSRERLAQLEESTHNSPGFSVTWINFEHWRDENHSFEEMAGFQNAGFTLTGHGNAVLTHAALVTHTLFHLTGTRPLLGRLFTESDDRPGAPGTVLLAYNFWAKTFGGDPAVLNKSLTLNGKDYQIIGVLPPSFKFKSVDYYLPLGPIAGTTVNRAQHGSMRVLALLKPGVTLTVARQDLDAIMRRLAISDPGPESDHQAYVAFYSEVLTGDVRTTLLLLMGAVTLVLILACANVASLLLVRSTARTREVAIRTAIGAGRGRLARQLLTENLAIALIGGGFGIVLAAWCLHLLKIAGPVNIPRLSEVSLDPQMLLFGIVVTIVVGLLAGLAPVLTTGKVDLATALKEGSPASAGGKRGNSLRNTLVIAEIAITLVLSFAAGLLLRSLIVAQTAYPGFDAHNILTLELQLPRARYRSNQAIQQFYNRLMQSLRREPGVESVGATNCPVDDCDDYWYSIVGRPAPPRGDVPLFLFDTVDSDYFRVMHMTLLAGRGFTEADRENATPLAVINEEIARKWWHSPQEALGQQLKFGGPYRPGSVFNIIGVVGNVKQMGLDQVPMPQAYFAFSQHPDSAMVVMIRTKGDPSHLMSTVRRDLARLDRNVPIQSLRPFEEWLGATLTRRRFTTLLLGVFAVLAIVLATVGIYGVLNYWVTVRQKEIAVRIALGARQSAILRWAAAHAARLAAFGIVLGLMGSWAASVWLKSLVFGISARNPGMLIASAAAVVGIAFAAAAIPLWRAIRVDPVSNLHDA